MKRRFLIQSAILLLFALAVPSLIAQNGTQFEIAISPSIQQGPVTGRLILVLSKKAEPEPRLQISPIGAAIFGLDIEQLPAGKLATLTSENSVGSPKQLADLPPGEYFAQAVINLYTHVQRADGHKVWVHFNDDNRMVLFNTASGNIYSDTQVVKIGGSAPIRLNITRVIPPAEPPKDTDWLKHVRIKSQKLSAFWGHPIYINATVLLPKGYAEHPDSYYPTLFVMGHSLPFSFTKEPATDRERQQAKRAGLEPGYDFYQAWNSANFPRFIAVTFQQPTPFFADSYSVNSANQGPYGDAMIEEVVPALETQFRMIRKPYARHVEGASTGGWQTLALQLYHPDYFGGAWVLQPDPIDFRHYQLSNIYEDENAFTFTTGPFTSAERPMRRTVTGQVVWTQRELSRFEAVLGSRGRSGFQLGAWEAIYGPVGPDGYPVPLWDKLTGKIDRKVAEYMRDHGYDLRAYAEKNWATIGPKLAGKLHFFSGDMDDFYLNLAVYDFEEFMHRTQNPHYVADFTYGRPMKGHSWHAWTWSEFVRKVAEQVKRDIPPGDNTDQWNY